MLKSFRIGHFTDEALGTGVTAIICDKGATGGVSVRGAAPATRETDLLDPKKSVEKVNAVVLSGGSAFGLEAASGVMRRLYEEGVGYDAGKYKVPIVAGASIYDLEYKEFAFPDAEAGYKAACAAEAGNFTGGATGGAAGATVSKLLGQDYAVKTELGVATYSLNGIEIAVISVVNALGDVIGADGGIIAGAKASDGSFVDMQKIMSAGGVEPKATNTTVSCILTNAALTKTQANILADLAHDGYAKALRPVHTLFDGDAVFALASGEKKVEFNILTAIIPELTAAAIRASVTGAAGESRRISPVLFGIFQKMWKR